MPSSRRERMLFTSLPTDVLLYICRELLVNDILALRQTCRVFKVVSHERSVWIDALRIHVVRKGLPVPGLHSRPLESLSTHELEKLTLRSLQFHHNWTSALPAYSRRIDIFPPVLSLMRARNLMVQFLPGRENRWLLTITLYDQQAGPRRFIMQCWDVLVEEPHCMAVLSFMNMAGICVNSDPNSPAVLAVSRRGPSDMVNTTLYSIDFTAEDPENAFKCTKEFSSYRHSISFDGRIFIASDQDNIVRIIDTETGQLQGELLVPLPFEDPTLRNEEHRCLAAMTIYPYVLTFCKQWIHLYCLPSRDPSLAVLNMPSAKHAIPRLDPIAKFKWQWRIDSLVISPCRRLSPSVDGCGAQAAKVFPSINILIRFDTWFPWPVNILHHFILPSNPICPDRTDADAKPDDWNLPYLFSSLPADGPSMANSIPSPVRLFTPSDMVLGPYGTALWIDAQTDPHAPAQAGDHGQRIVGKILSDPRTMADYATGTEGAGADRVSPGFVEVRSGVVDASQLSAAAPDAYSPMMVFNLRERDEGWNRLALDEEEGRIAVGSVDGKVTLFEYIPE